MKRFGFFLEDGGRKRLLEIEADRGHRRRESSAAPGAKRATTFLTTGRTTLPTSDRRAGIQLISKPVYGIYKFHTL